MRVARQMRLSAFAMLALSLAACSTGRLFFDPLPSWREGGAKARVLEFVTSTTNPQHANWRPPAERIAVFDHDGTLLVEKPELVQMEFIFDRVRHLADEHPEWGKDAAFRAAIERDGVALADMGFRERAPLMNAAQSGLSARQFHRHAENFLVSARHPRFGQVYSKMHYLPMLELVEHLHRNDFRVFIVSGGGVHFIRALAESVYGIPRERVIGSRTKIRLRDVDGRLEIVRQAGFSALNVGRFKALNIQEFIGRRPILAVGNSDGDLDMLRFTDTGAGSLAILIHHNDADREYDYDKDTERVRAVAQERGWLQLSMRDDLVRVFPAVTK